jgi:ribosomal protein L11 methyltransferase
MTAWRELVIEVGRDEADPWSDALLGAGALSVQAEDADADSPDEQPLYGEPGLTPDPLRVGALAGWRRTVLTALFDVDIDPQAVVGQTAAALGVAAPPVREVREVADRDWVHATQSQFDPIPIGDRLVITPSWHVDAVRDAALDGAPGDARLAIVLDPGLAFGTGSHPTTRLCLQWLERHVAPGDSVIDYGCGSGVLAIAAARLGAAAVVAIDIDPQALQATRDNAMRNSVTLDVRGTGEAHPAQADVVVANILSSPLKLLAPLLASLVRPGGRLVLSGVLERQIDEVSECYRDLLPLDVAGRDEGWACLAGAKPR